jgi:hypothetical protein
MGVLVGAEVEHGVVFFEDMLGAVSVMDIEINDEHSPKADLLGIPCADSDVIEYAESHCFVGFGMVTGGAHRAERAFYLSALAFVDRFNHSACRKQRCFTAMLRDIGVTIVKAGE